MRLITLILILFIIPIAVDAVKIDNPLQYNSFQDLINKLIDFIFILAIAIAPIMIIVAGFYFITAAGDPAKIEIAKEMIRWTLIGLLIVIAAKGIIALFGEIFKVKTPYNP